MLRREMLGFAAVGALVLSAAVTPAHAGFGAVAYDQDTGKYGATWNEPTQASAFEAALKQCASSNCRVYPVEPKGCAALALSDQDKAWGGADRETLAQARTDAVARCRTHTAAGTCAVRVSGCNQ